MIYMKKILKFLLCIALMLASIIIIYYHYKTEEVKDTDNEVITKEETDVITPLIEEYYNDDIIAKLVIPGVIETPIVKGEDNEYYINHDLYKDINDQGAIFIDYRTNINEKKLLVYSHNNNPKISIFNNLTKYEDNDFYLKHPKIYLYLKNKVKTYDIFSVYREKEDLSYTNLKSFNGFSYLEHIKSLKEKSIHQNEIELNGANRIIILDTYLLDENKKEEHFLVMGVLEE